MKISEEEAFSALEKYKNSSITSVTSYNRSIVFNNEKIGPDIGWIVPPGFKWNNKYKIDFSVRGHNTKIPDPPNRKFFGWNDGDAVGLYHINSYIIQNGVLELILALKCISRFRLWR